jgi:L-rhamnose-H+ transport protein
MVHVPPFPTLVAAGAVNASFALPMKFMRKWPWENVWLVWGVFALLIFPLALGCFGIPGFVTLFMTSGAAALKIAAFGALWGIGQVLFGFALEAIGISLATAIMLGISTAIGTLAPLVVTGTGSLPALRVGALVAGIVLTVAGVVLCAHAGHRRESERNGVQNREAHNQGHNQDAERGIVFAVAAGFGAGLFNFAMAFGGPLIERATRAGGVPELAQMAAWTPFLMAGAVANIGYCVVRMARRNTFGKFVELETSWYWLGGMTMAALWLGSALLYGVAAKQMGQMGPVFAWPVYMSLIVTGTAAIGVMTGEWRAASRSILATMSSGVGSLLVAVFVISFVGAQRG